MEILNLRRNKEILSNENSNILFTHIFIYYNIVKEILKSEKEEARLSLRKNQLNNILSSKRKICNMSNINDEIREQYTISLEDIDIPEELKINIPKFFQNVNILFYNGLYIIFSLI